MLELVLSAAVFWVIWKILDALFSRKPKSAEGQFLVKAADGQYYLVEEIDDEPETPEPETLPDNVTWIRRR